MGWKACIQEELVFYGYFAINQALVSKYPNTLEFTYFYYIKG
jgi:hypothetical protein